jgi:hypothetical protein
VERERERERERRGRGRRGGGRNRSLLRMMMQQVSKLKKQVVYEKSKLQLHNNALWAKQKNAYGI